MMNDDENQETEDKFVLWPYVILAVLIVGAGIFYAVWQNRQLETSQVVLQVEPEFEPESVLEQEVVEPTPYLVTEEDRELIKAGEPVYYDDLSEDVENTVSETSLADLNVEIPVLATENKRLPLQHSCYRSNISPPVKWEAGPEGTETFALVMEKMQEGNEPYSYWVLFNIPAEVTSLSSALPKTEELEDGTRYGRNDHGVVEYTGPCDARGIFNYRIRVFALNQKMELPAGTESKVLLKGIQPYLLGESTESFIHVLKP